MALSSAALAQSGGYSGVGAAPGSHRAAQDEGLSLFLDRDFLEKHQGVVVEQPPEAEASEGLAETPDTAARNPRADLSRKLNKDWNLNPVLLNRSQSGKPLREGDDLREETLGIELQKKF